MPHTPFHEAIADSFAAVESALDDAIPGRGARVQALLSDPSLRDEWTWRRLMRQAEIPDLSEDDWDHDWEDLLSVPREDRGPMWQAVAAVFLSCAQVQVDATLIRPLWSALEKGNLAVLGEARKLLRPLSREARRGPSKSTFAAAKKRLTDARQK